ncbi:MAG TPA: hypothetical protein VKE40_06025 [Gemmataceae bacterium]|nr:hypothetical protein [Gemmataceae bacterium]
MSRHAKPQVIDWFGRKVIVVENGTDRGKRGRPRRFTPAALAELRKQAETTPVVELAQHYGVSRQRIYQLLGRSAEPGTPGGRWTAREDQLVRTLPIFRVVARTGRSVVAVRARRQFLGVTRPAARLWTTEEDLLVMRLPTQAAAAKTGRTVSTVSGRRKFLGIRVVGGNAGRVR